MEWRFEPSVVAGLVLLTVGYLAGIGQLRSRVPGAGPVSAARQAAFLAGVATLVVALLSPLDALSDEYLFSAHMVQHLLLTLVAPPLLLLGTPGWLLWPPLRSARVLGAARLVTKPVVAFLLANGVLWLWHWPALYDLALESNGLHIFEHLTFVVTSLLLWWPVLSPLPELPRLSHPLQILYLFLTSLACGALGALITLQGDVIYLFYQTAPRVWGLAPLDDQRLGGLIMWVGATTYYLVIVGVVFLAWASRESAEDQPSAEGAASRASG